MGVHRVADRPDVPVAPYHTSSRLFCCFLPSLLFIYSFLPPRLNHRSVGLNLFLPRTKNPTRRTGRRPPPPSARLVAGLLPLPLFGRGSYIRVVRSPSPPLLLHLLYVLTLYRRPCAPKFPRVISSVVLCLEPVEVQGLGVLTDILFLLFTGARGGDATVLEINVVACPDMVHEFSSFFVSRECANQSNLLGSPVILKTHSVVSYIRNECILIIIILAFCPFLCFRNNLCFQVVSYSALSLFFFVKLFFDFHPRIYHTPYANPATPKSWLVVRLPCSLRFFIEEIGDKPIKD